jgi:hypothetical protein
MRFGDQQVRFFSFFINPNASFSKALHMIEVLKNGRRTLFFQKTDRTDSGALRVTATLPPSPVFRIATAEVVSGTNGVLQTQDMNLDEIEGVPVPNF